LQAIKSALKAILVNRISDFGISLGILSIILFYFSAFYSIVFYVTSKIKNITYVLLNQKIDILLCILLLLFIGAIGKSAQILLHT
jgi:NADH-quinone oxidoreductase subunit L